MALSSANRECHCMNPVGPFQSASPALTESGRSARAPLANASSGQGSGSGAGTVASLHFQEALAQAHPTSPQTGRPVRVQAGETLIGITRRVLQEQGQAPKEAEVHRVAMAVAKSNALANPNLIRAGQTLSFPALALSRTAPELAPSEKLAAPEKLAIPEKLAPPETVSKLSPEPTSVAPRAPVSPSTGPKIAIVGDSIAVGIGGALLKQSGITPEFAPGRKFLTQHQGAFAVNAVGGHSSPQILSQLNKDAGVKNADLAIISVGTNDLVNSTVNKYYTPERITQNLQRIRADLNAKDRIWVLPYDPKARELVESVAKERGDKTIDLAQFQPADRYHPRNYAAIASSLTPWVNPLQVAQTAVAAPGQQAWVSTQNALLARGAKF
jgi:lysophospholipase L1-like esterase